MATATSIESALSRGTRSVSMCKNGGYAQAVLPSAFNVTAAFLAEEEIE